MSHLAQLSAAVGFLLPLLLAVIQQTHWSRGVQSIVAAVACVIAAVITAAVNGDLDPHSLVTSLTVIYTLSQVTYRNFWKPTGVAPKIEANTTVNNNP